MVVLLIPLAIAVAVAGRWPATGKPLAPARHVLVVATPRLALHDLRDGPLARLVTRSAVGAMSVRALHTRPEPAEGYLALGSGVRSQSVRAVDRRDVVVDANGRVRAIRELIAANRGRRLGSVPGALGGALRAAGRDVVAGTGPVALAAMDRGGAVTVARGDPLALVKRHDVVIADTPTAAAAARLLKAAAAGDTLVMLVSVSPAPDGHLTPVVLRGAGVRPGRLVSDSTRRDGIVTLGDVAPTILAALGVPRPAGMPGRPLRTRAGAPELGRLLDLEARSARQASAFRLAIYLTAAALLALVALARVRSARLATTVALAAAALPLATYLIRLFGPAGSDLIFNVLIALIAAATAVGARLATRDARAALIGVLGLTALVLGVDGATTGWLHTTTMLGYSLPGGGRFYGMPNTTFSLLAAATILAAGLLVERYGRAALPGVATAFAVVALLNCLPGLGSDVGGLLTLTPVFGLTWLGLSGRRIRVRDIALLAAAAAALLVVLAGVDVLRPDDARTHLGRLAADVLDSGPAPLWDAVARKESANFRLLFHSPWSVALVVVLAVPLLLRTGLGATMRVAVAGNLALAVLGFAANDSGPVVVALSLFYLAPLLVVLRRTEEVTAPPAPQRAAASPASAGR